MFAGEGGGRRGDLKAVIRAILLDPEAERDLKAIVNYGRLRHPVLVRGRHPASVWRAICATAAPRATVISIPRA